MEVGVQCRVVYLPTSYLYANHYWIHRLDLVNGLIKKDLCNQHDQTLDQEVFA